MSSRPTSAGRRGDVAPRPRIARRPAELKAINAELRARNLQQAAVASLGQHAIRDRDLTTLMEEAAVVTATTLGTAYSAVAEMLPDGQRFLMRAGVGWKAGVVGGAHSSEGTPVEYTLRTGEPVVIPDVRTESRFPIPARLIEHGVAGAIFVIIKGRVRPWGVLAAYSIRARTFTEDDIGFLQSMANVLALAVERHELEVLQRRENEILQAMFDNIPVTISFFDGSGRLMRVNREWERVLGWTLEEAQRVDILAEAYPDPDYRKGVVDFMPRTDRKWGDFRTRTRDGTIIDTSWVRFKLSDGSRMGFGLDLTERKRAEKALAASEARFATLFESSPVALGMSTIEEGRIIAVNQRWLEVFGYRRDEVIGRTNGDLNIFMRPEARRAMIEHVRQGGVARNLEMQIRRKSGEVRDVMVSGVAVHLGAADEYWISAWTDITDRKREQAERDRLLEGETQARAQAEAALEKLRAIQSITDSALVHLGADELLRELLARLRQALNADSATAMLLDETNEQLYPRAWDGEFVPDIATVRVPLGEGLSGRIVAEGRPLIVNDGSTIDVSGISGTAHAGVVASRSLMGAPLEVGGKVIGAVIVAAGLPRRFTEEDLEILRLVADRVAPAMERARLVEEARAAHERTGALSRRLLTAHEEERRRLAVELHDELGQVLTAVKINLESLARSSSPGPAPAQLDEAIGSVDQAMHRVRDIALDLRPSVLDDLGLPSALRWYVDRFARDAHVEVHVSIDAIPDLDPGIATACFRVAQEALTNVARHARARHVWLDLHLLKDAIELRVHDDGGGFDATAARQRAALGASMGLLGMQERVSLVGGEFQVRSPTGGGTEIRVRFPLNKEPRKPA